MEGDEGREVMGAECAGPRGLSENLGFCSE